MKRIGLIGGMSWESSARYYKLINEGVRDELGELHSANIIMSSFDFYELEKYQNAGQWMQAATLIGDMSKELECAGVDAIAICSVTGHNNTDIITQFLCIPLLHIADGINNKIKGMKRVGLLGTKYTMKLPYFKDKLDAEVIVPDEEYRESINNIIYNELCLGEVDAISRQMFSIIINQLVSKGAEAIILGCTELGLLVDPRTCGIPILDSTIIHAKAIVKYALEVE